MSGGGAERRREREREGEREGEREIESQTGFARSVQSLMPGSNS